MQTALFPDAPHDPGGKVRTRLPAGMVGYANISPCGRYRDLLTRVWEPGWQSPTGHPLSFLPPYALWIGMNPSTAEVDFNDPTVSREVKYTREQLGLSAYVKCNVMDYRATDPAALLLLPPHERCTPTNILAIRLAASRAERVILAFGTLPKPLREHAADVMELLARFDIPTFCVGTTKDGSPRHPLYVKGNAPLLPYPPGSIS